MLASIANFPRVLAFEVPPVLAVISNRLTLAVSPESNAAAAVTPTVVPIAAFSATVLAPVLLSVIVGSAVNTLLTFTVNVAVSVLAPSLACIVNVCTDAVAYSSVLFDAIVTTPVLAAISKIPLPFPFVML